MVQIEQGIAYRDTTNSLRISNGTVELIISTDYGPRILKYGFVGDPDENNVFGRWDGITLQTKLGDWHIRGGHRLWIAPETAPKSYEPDNSPVPYEIAGNLIILRPQTEPFTHIRKEIQLILSEEGTHVTVAHTLINEGVFPVEMSVWAVSVMNKNGIAIFPQEPYQSHSDNLLPVRPLVMWAYTDLTDPRWTWGKKFLALRQDPALSEPQKIGFLNRQGWAAYARNGILFTKRYHVERGLPYPDFHVNTETFTNAEMLEIETMGALKLVEPGEIISHVETWELQRKEVGKTEAEWEAAF